MVKLLCVICKSLIWLLASMKTKRKSDCRDGYATQYRQFAISGKLGKFLKTEYKMCKEVREIFLVLLLRVCVCVSMSVYMCIAFTKKWANPPDRSY